jgi:Flp pilus assembly protein TadG
MKVNHTKRNGERGSVLATGAVGMLAMLLAVGLAVDIGHLYVVKAELKNASDAAALAGASALNGRATGINQAVSRATSPLNKVEFNNTDVAFVPTNVTFAVNLDGPYMSASAAASSPANIRFVKVTTPNAGVKMAFAALVIGSTQNLSSMSIAGMSVSANEFCDWIPLAVIDSDTATLIPGNLYTIRGGSQNSVSPGDYQILAPVGPGGSDARIGLSQGVKQCLKPGDTVATKPGVSAGDIRQGLNTRFDEYSGPVADPATQPPDLNIKQNINYTQYRDGSPSQSPTHQGVQGRRVVLMPIIKKSDFDQGRDTVKIDRFAAFFLQTGVQGGNGGNILAEYINVRVMNAGSGYDPTGGPGNPQVVTPVLYK